MNTGKKLTAIQNKIATIQERLEAGKAGGGYSAASSCSDLSGAYGDFRATQRRRSLFVSTLEKQTFYAHCCKVVFLLSVSVVHLVYLQPFLDVCSTVEDYAMQIHVKYPTATRLRGIDTRVLEEQANVLNDYKKNIWMTIASMCVALSTSCFFLFLLPTTKLRWTHVIMMGVVDLAAFGTLPALLVTRAMIVENLNANLPAALQMAHRLVSAERLMNALQCTINPREKLPFCADVVLKSLFPWVILKFLLILALFTLAYIGLAYLIEWCIRHFFPPNGSACVHVAAGCHRCTQCQCYRRGANYKRSLSAASLRSGPLLRQYHNKSYMPVFLPPTSQSEKASLIGQAVNAGDTSSPFVPARPAPIVLPAPAEAAPTSPTESEPAPAEPIPSEPSSVNESV